MSKADVVPVCRVCLSDDREWVRHFIHSTLCSRCGKIAICVDVEKDHDQG